MGSVDWITHWGDWMAFRKSLTSRSLRGHFEVTSRSLRGTSIVNKSVSKKIGKMQKIFEKTCKCLIIHSPSSAHHYPLTIIRSPSSAHYPLTITRSPSTHHHPLIIHSPSSAHNHLLTIIHSLLSAHNHPLTIIHPPSSTQHHPPTIIHPPSSTLHHPSTIIHPPTESLTRSKKITRKRRRRCCFPSTSLLEPSSNEPSPFPLAPPFPLPPCPPLKTLLLRQGQ